MERKGQIQKLWQICFNDPKEFIRLFFERVYKDENAISIEKEGSIVSVLQMLPYTMRWQGMDIPVSYIYAACTSPTEQGKGLMRKLLQKTFATMRERGFLATALIPASPSLFEFYRAHGYTEVFDYSLNTYTKTIHKTTENKYYFVSFDEKPDTAWYTFFDNKLKERPACILHSEDDFHTLVQDVKNGKGEVCGIINKQNIPVGLALSNHREGKSILIREIVYNDEEAKEALLWELTNHTNALFAYYRTPARLPDSQRLGMGMILDRDKMIRIWKQKNPNHSITIQDLEKMDIQSLTRFLFDYPNRKAYMSLMLD